MLDFEGILAILIRITSLESYTTMIKFRREQGHKIIESMLNITEIFNKLNVILCLPPW